MRFAAFIVGLVLAIVGVAGLNVVIQSVTRYRGNLRPGRTTEGAITRAKVVVGGAWCLALIVGIVLVIWFFP